MISEKKKNNDSKIQLTYETKKIKMKFKYHSFNGQRATKTTALIYLKC